MLQMSLISNQFCFVNILFIKNPQNDYDMFHIRMISEVSRDTEDWKLYFWSN